MRDKNCKTCRYRISATMATHVQTNASVANGRTSTWGYQVDVLDALKAFLEVLLDGFGIPRLPQYLQQVVVGHEVEPREDHPVQQNHRVRAPFEHGST